MIHLVQSLDGVSARGCDAVDCGLGVLACLMQEFGCAFHCLYGYLECIFRVEAHLDTGLGLHTQESHDVGNSTRCHEHTRCHEFLGTYKHIAHQFEEVFHLIYYIVIDSVCSSDECHALAEFGCYVGYDIKDWQLRTLVLCEQRLQVVECHTSGKRNEYLLRCEAWLYVGNHGLHLPWLYSNHNHIGRLHSTTVVGHDVDIGAVVLDFVEFLPVYPRHGNLSILSCFAPSASQCAPYVSGANNGDVSLHRWLSMFYKFSTKVIKRSEKWIVKSKKTRYTLPKKGM